MSSTDRARQQAQRETARMSDEQLQAAADRGARMDAAGYQWTEPATRDAYREAIAAEIGRRRG